MNGKRTKWRHTESNKNNLQASNSVVPIRWSLVGKREPNVLGELTGELCEVGGWRVISHF
jgi:hypothetical protein